VREAERELARARCGRATGDASGCTVAPSARRQNARRPDCEDCAIRAISVCAALDRRELERLRAITVTYVLAADESLFREGDPAEHLFNVVAGSVKLVKLLADGRQQITGFLYPGDFIGVAFNDTYAYSAEAIEPLRLCRFDRRALEALMADFPKLERRLLARAGNEIVAAQDQMVVLGRKTARERVATFLLAIARRAAGSPPTRGSARALDLPMRRADIADYLGLTIETVSRTFTALQQDRVIAVERRTHVDILDTPALVHAAGGPR
jgi:CRP/FNR family transcriptional regulator